ncbi:MAG: type IX secretion system sortase PorU [Cytophagaceae bacterium]|nr:type IX secretion system sortase PorU [Cytophagaceae bacterium]
MLGQSQVTAVLEQTVVWNESEYLSALPFKGEGEVSDTTLVYRYRFPVSEAIEPSSLVVKFDNERWTPDADSLASIYKNTDAPKYDVVFINKEAFVDVEVVPVKIIEGTAHRLESFSCAVEYTKGDMILKNAQVQDRYACQSVLASGKWMKVSVAETGIHKITYAQLLEWGFSSPNKVRVFGYGGEMLPEANNDYRPDDLPETPAWHYNSAIYFYAQNNVVWKWNSERNMFLHILHNYVNHAVYFLTDKNGTAKPVAELPAETAAINTTVTQFDDRQCYEEEFTNFHSTGKLWVSKEWFSNSTQKFSFSFPARNVAEPVSMFTQVATSGSVDGTFQYAHEGKNIATIKVVGNSNNYAQLGSRAVSFSSTSQNVALDIKYGHTGAKGYLDFIDLNARSNLNISGAQLLFRDKQSNGTGKVALFRIAGASAGTVVWDVTNRTAITKLPTAMNGNYLEFKTSTATLKEFAAFNPSGEFPCPVRVGDVANQNLHGVGAVDYIIVAHPDFHTQAQELADLHFQYHGLNTVIVTPEQIYNEFAWGHQDPVAIRSFAKMIYDRNGGIKYLLLFGDGSFDNRGIKPDNKYHQYNIVTCETGYSTGDSSYATDDWFGFLDDNESTTASSSKVDIAIGRFPVETAEEASIAVAKVRKYLEEQTYGMWRKRVTFLGDDLDNQVHMRQSDESAGIIEEAHPEFDIRKIYTDNYPKVTSTGGKTYPAASEAVNRAIVDGTLVFTYVGHGGPSGFSHEKVVTLAHARKWNNIKELVFFMTFTCDLAPFDKHDIIGKSFGEQLFLNPYGGAIALFTTTREVYISNNGTLNRKIHEYLFAPNTDGCTRSIGEIIMHTKQNMGDDLNMQRFVLLGDPALRLCYPDRYRMQLLTVNDTIVEKAAPLQAKSTVRLAGHITDERGNRYSQFNGIADVVVYDKDINYATMGNDGEAPFEFREYSNIIFKGKSTVKNGMFKTEFVVPQDIRYNIDKGKVSMYASTDDGGTQAMGVNKDIVVGGLGSNANADNAGPKVQLYLNHNTFHNGETTGQSPLLFATFEDESGINVGNGIGHDILLVIDGDKNNPVVLNSYFQGETDNYRRGTVVYQLAALDRGNHEISLKVWDTYNNSTTARLDFVVSDLNELKVSNFALFPVPVHPYEPVYFSFDMDDPNSVLTITAEGINLAGQLTGSRAITTGALGNNIPQTSLLPSDIGITKAGIYFVRFVIVSDSGKKSQVAKKIMVQP